jgi:hypothetical protein
MTVQVNGFAYGVPVSFAVAPGLLAEVVELLPPDWTDRAVPDDTPCWTIDSAGAAPVQINNAELHVAENSPGLVFIHAGAVAFDGAAILLPGRSFSGKSSLTHALVRAGGTYYSDEFALLQPNGDVLPYPRALALRGSDGSFARRIPIDALPSVGSGPARVALVAALRYDAELGWAVDEPGAAAGVLALIDNAVAAQSRPAEVLAASAAAMANGRFKRGSRGAADGAARQLIELLERA